MTSISPAPVSEHPWRSWWTLDPQRIYLNHGAFGACPRPVLERQIELRAQLERNPVGFMIRDLEPLLDEARVSLAEFVGVQPSDLAFVPNATTGVNTVLRSLSLSSEDELLTTNQEYNACRNALEAVAQGTGARIVVASIPFPLETEEQIVAAILREVTERTRLVLVDHITSMTGIVFPIATLAAELNHHAIDLLVDGAHAPGQIPVNIAELGVAYYTGNAHKWLCAPKGSGFLYVREDKQAQVRPLTISHGANSPRSDRAATPQEYRSRFHLEFDWTGTSDPTPYLCVPAALNFIHTQFPGGWPALMAHNHQTILQARDLLCETLQVAPPVPDGFLGSMVSLPLPAGDAQSLYDRLALTWGIEVAIMPFPEMPQRLLRTCAQVYNTQTDYHSLAIALAQLLELPHPFA